MLQLAHCGSLAARHLQASYCFISIDLIRVKAGELVAAAGVGPDQGKGDLRITIASALMVQVWQV